MTEETRQFDSGATRDTIEGKLSYVRALSPIVLQRYVQYLDVHRKQSDGSMREFDNWKQGIPKEAYLDGSGRHFVAVWLLEHGFPASDNHGPVTLENSLCGIIFNAMGRLHELLKDEKQRDDTEPEKYGEFTIRKAHNTRKGWYIIVTKSAGQGHCSKFLHKNLEIQATTGWAPHFDYGEADGYYDNKIHARSYIRMYESKPFVCPEGWEITYNDPDNYHRCGWYVFNNYAKRHLHKNLQLYDSTGMWGHDWKFGEAPGYWSTKQEAEAALAAYLEKTKKTSTYCKHCEEKIRRAANGDAVGLCRECSRL